MGPLPLPCPPPFLSLLAGRSGIVAPQRGAFGQNWGAVGPSLSLFWGRTPDHRPSSCSHSRLPTPFAADKPVTVFEDPKNFSVKHPLEVPPSPPPLTLSVCSRDWSLLPARRSCNCAHAPRVPFQLLYMYAYIHIYWMGFRRTPSHAPPRPAVVCAQCSWVLWFDAGSFAHKNQKQAMTWEESLQKICKDRLPVSVSPSPGLPVSRSPSPRL